MKTAPFTFFSRRSLLTLTPFLLFSSASAMAEVPTSTFMPFPVSNQPYYIGEETQFYRKAISPSVFPILSAGINLESSNEDRVDEYKIDANFKISPSHPRAFTLSSRNLYYGERDDSTESPLRFTFGRRLIGWSALDENWQLGAFEPIDSWDRLRSFTQGLTGIFAFSETKQLNFRIFISYLYMPELSPNVVIDHDNFVAEHPQGVTTAPQSYPIRGHLTPVGYVINVPRLDKIIFQPSFAFMVETKKEIPVHGKFSYAYEPLNFFPIAIDGGLSLQTSNVLLNLRPIIMHHHLYNAEAFYQLNDALKFGTAYLIDDPVNPILPSNYTYTPLSTSFTLSPWVEYQFPRLKLMLSQIWTRGGIEKDSGNYADTDPRVNLFSSRMLYRNATQLAAKYDLGEIAFRPRVQIKYIHEYSIDANWIAADLYVNPAKNLTFFVGGDVIKAARNVSPDRGAEFLSDMQALDRVRLGAIYAF